MLCFSTRYVSIYCGLVLFCAGLLATATDNACGQTSVETTLPQVDPQSLGFDTEHLQQIDALVSEGIAAGKMPAIFAATLRFHAQDC